MTMEHDDANWFNNLKEQLTEYVDLKIEITKLTIYEKSAKVAAVFSSVLVISFLTLFFFLFVFLAAAIWIGDMLGNRSLGFLIVACFYFLLLFVFLMIRKNVIEKRIIDKVIEILTEEEHEEANQ